MSAKSAKPRKRPSKKRGIIKIASLGLAGLIAGLLSGCSAAVTSPALTITSPEATVTATPATEPSPSSDNRR